MVQPGLPVGVEQLACFRIRKKPMDAAPLTARKRLSTYSPLKAPSSSLA